MLNLSKQASWRLHDRFASIAARPSAEPDLVLKDDRGRAIFVRVEGDWLLDYWVDHEAKQVIILDLEETPSVE